MYSQQVVIIRRKRAEGLIYIGKCQNTKWWSSLPYYIPPLLRTLSPNVLYYRRIAKQKDSKSKIEKGKHIPKRIQVILSSTLQNYSTVSFRCPQLRSDLPTSSNQDSSKLEIITAAVTAVTAVIVTVVENSKKVDSWHNRTVGGRTLGRRTP